MIFRKLKEIGQALDLMTTGNDPTDPLNKPENEQKLDGVLDDIRYALMDYQVCTSMTLAPNVNVSDIWLRLHCNENSTIRTVD